MDLINKILSTYRIPGNFHGMYISWLSNQSGFSWMKFHGWEDPKFFTVFTPRGVKWARRIRFTILSEIYNQTSLPKSISQSAIDAVNRDVSRISSSYKVMKLQRPTRWVYIKNNCSSCIGILRISILMLTTYGFT